MTQTKDNDTTVIRIMEHTIDGVLVHKVDESGAILSTIDYTKVTK